MSRSVNFQSGAEIVEYAYVDESEYLEDVCENLEIALQNAFPSFDRVPAWNRTVTRAQERAWSHAERENWPILANGNCVVYMSEYMGFVSLSFCPEDDYQDNWPRDLRGIQRHWIRSAEKRIRAAIASVATRVVFVDRFSNGEALFCRA
jgi:hypothetical protein